MSLEFLGQWHKVGCRALEETKGKLWADSQEVALGVADTGKWTTQRTVEYTEKLRKMSYIASVRVQCKEESTVCL